jgi:catechol 2,3-dioxygenase-like lactoylglutathione lyase family enzyme
MKYSFRAALLLLFFSLSCSSPHHKELASFEVFCEMVGSGAKPLALSHPMEPTDADALWDEFQAMADDYGVALFREDRFPETLLFPTRLTEGKTVVLIYKANRLRQYQQWKEDLAQAGPADAATSEALARRFGRLLGYTPGGINSLLAGTSGYRTLKSFGVTGQTTHLYYEDLPGAQEFYANTLGLQRVDSIRFQISRDAFLALHPLTETHPGDQPRSTAIALLTGQLPDWYARLQERGVPIKYPFKPKEGGAHDGFVALDPGGYLLEFEAFKQHPENEYFMAVLEGAPRIATTASGLNFHGSITWTYHKDLLGMQQFYEEVLGFPPVADQGWTKIYQTAPNSFIGLVDECRGMEDYAAEKAVELEWELTDPGGFNAYAREKWEPYAYKNFAFRGPERYRYAVGPRE